MNLDFMGYEEDVITRFAAGLYAQAKLVVQMAWVIVVLMVCAALYVGVEEGMGAMLAALGGAAVAALVVLGAAKTLAGILILKAQTAMCQVQIEINTRRVVSSLSRPGAVSTEELLDM